MLSKTVTHTTALIIGALILLACLPTASNDDAHPTTAPTSSVTHPPNATTPSGTQGAVTPPVIPDFSHVFIIVMENKEAEHVTGDDDAPYFNQLAATYASAANYYGVTHPSLPNYLALTGGDTFGISSDCTDCFVDADNLAAQLDSAGRTWKAYMESMSGPCVVGNERPGYAQKHNPFIYFDNIRTDPRLCNQIVPFSEFADDLASGDVPEFVWITPDMCNDTHDCSVRTGDDWLKTWVPQILASDAWKQGGALFITYDEGVSGAGCCTYAHGGHIATLVISPLGKPGYVSQVEYDHYSLLRTVETAWGLPLLGNAACDCTPLMSDFFVEP